MRTLKEKYRMLLEETDISYIRNIHDTIAWNERLIAIIGSRGVGKTTMVLQHIKLHEDTKSSLFVFADDIWFSTHTILELADEFYKDGGKELFIDEIHKYKNWSQEIKNIYDSFPKLRACICNDILLQGTFKKSIYIFHRWYYSGLNIDNFFPNFQSFGNHIISFLLYQCLLAELEFSIFVLTCNHHIC